MPFNLNTCLRALLPLCALMPLQHALADGGRGLPAHMPPAYQQECASCHVAYPPGMLPARSWQRVMNGLDKHFGTDASIDAAMTESISRWLQSHAGADRRVSEEPPQDRITRSAWFARKHRKVEPAVWQLPSVKRAANCAACHTGAERGRFDDDELRAPAGLTPRQRMAWHD
jgi:mono/diheme cytochrome c family protein